MHQLLDLLGETSCSNSAAARSAIPWALRPGAIANRVALEAMILARNEGRDYLHEGPEILAKAAQICSPLKAALEVWKDVTFNYESTDMPDYVPTPSLRCKECKSCALPKAASRSCPISPTSRFPARSSIAWSRAGR
jgi:ribulose-bisphosphate carboxylase large chain